MSDTKIPTADESTTVFDKIISREIPAEIVYEDETALAFLDIDPVNLGHVLVIPKTPFRNLFDADETALAHMMIIARRVAQAQKAALDCDGVNLMMNNEVGQDVFHAHLHVIPRYFDEYKITINDKVTYADGEAARIGSTLKTQLQTDEEATL